MNKNNILSGLTFFWIIIFLYSCGIIGPSDELENRKWVFTIADTNNIPNPTIGTNGVVYVGNCNNLYALNSDGSQKWKINSNTEFGTPAIGKNNTPYVGKGRSLCAINNQGTIKWKYPVQEIIKHSPAIGADGTIYIGNGRELLAINPDSTKKWKSYISREIAYSPFIGPEGTIYVQTRDGFLYALNKNGNIKWKFNFGSHRGEVKIYFSNPAVDNNGNIYIGSQEGFYSITSSGRQKWKMDTNGKVVSAAVGANGLIYLKFNRKIYALNSDGKVQWKISTGTQLFSITPAIDKAGNIYDVGHSNLLYKIDSTGTNVNKSKLSKYSSLLSTPMIGPEGTIYVGTLNGKLVAMKGGGYGPADSIWPMCQHDPRRTGRAD